MTFTHGDGKKYLVKAKSYNIFKTISAVDTKYHYLCSDHSLVASDSDPKKFLVSFWTLESLVLSFFFEYTNWSFQ